MSALSSTGTFASGTIPNRSLDKHDLGANHVKPRLEAHRADDAGSAAENHRARRADRAGLYVKRRCRTGTQLMLSLQESGT
jgi:hypothetical protein